MDLNSMLKPIMKWVKNKKNVYGTLGMIGIIVILAMDFQYWADHIAVAEIGGGETTVPAPEEGEYEVVPKQVLSDSGSATFGRPNTQSDAVQYTFTIDENATFAVINVTHTSGVGRADIDLYILDPKGKQIASSASPEADESATIDEKKLKKSGPGQYTAVVDPYTGFNLAWNIEATVFYKVSCEECVCLV